LFDVQDQLFIEQLYDGNERKRVTAGGATLKSVDYNANLRRYVRRGHHEDEDEGFINDDDSDSDNPADDNPRYGDLLFEGPGSEKQEDYNERVGANKAAHKKERLAKELAQARKGKRGQSTQQLARPCTDSCWQLTKSA
jgi:hypothetical protein